MIVINKNEKFYWEANVKINNFNEDLFIWFCNEKGCLGSQIISYKNYTLLKVYFPEDINFDLKELFFIFNKNLSDNIPQVKVLKISLIKDEDWNFKWKKQFKKINLGKNIIVVPMWEKNFLTFKKKLIINPGQAFGTGHHQSTALAIEMLEFFASREKYTTLLDVGCGSGILSIAGHILGIKEIIGFDKEYNSVFEARINAQLNKIGSKTLFFQAKKNCVGKKFHIIVCNMLLYEIKEVLGNLYNNIEDNGILIISGITIFQSKELISLLKDYELRKVTSLIKDEWISLSFKTMNNINY